MRFTYLLVEGAGYWTAECQETNAMGEGMTRGEAIASLREALVERLFRPDAVAPPPEVNQEPIELVPA
ncbi:MAG: hypothetical protein FWD73_05570 [Polyangiaceae bacterium]|nr:hypothetical protein [Polyangiaceae bacterium]